MMAPLRDYWPTEGWRTATPEEHGLDGAVLAHMTAEAARTEPPANGVVIVRHGYIVYEQYFNGFGPDSCNTVNSVTKSVTSMLAGIARRDGLLGDLDQPAIELFPDIGVDDERKRRITIRHLLTMTSGFDPREAVQWGPISAEDPASEAWQRSMAYEPGEHFFYDDSAVHLLALILARVTRANLAEYAVRELFEPLGIWRDERSKFAWQTDPLGPHTFHNAGYWPDSGLPWKVDRQGNTIASFGSHFTLREMAKLGWLYVNKGWWDGRKIVPEDWVAESTREHSRGGFAPMGGGREPYGYLWWIDPEHPTVFIANGFGGQRIIVQPEADMVIAATTSTRPQLPGVIRRYLGRAVRD